MTASGDGGHGRKEAAFARRRDDAKSGPRALDRLAARLARRRVALGFASAVVVAVLARPTWASLRVGLAVALAGEALRVWAAGHLEKGREVTRSGPYRFVRHPLYLGSAIIALGVVLASRSPIAAALVLLYVGSTTLSAIRVEEAFLERQFGDAYEAYRRSAGTAAMRRFSVARAVRNREYRAVLGLGLGFGLMAVRALASQ